MQTQEDQVRVGIIGCGGRAGEHMRALSTNPGARIVGVADVAAAAAQPAGDRLGVPWYRDHRLLLERDDVDALWISVPVFAHGGIELDTIARGLPFFVEKPVARELDTAREIARALDRAGLWASVGYQLRYLPWIRGVRDVVASSTLAIAEGHYWCGTGRQDHWVADWERSGGQLVEQATHTIDLLRFFGGDVDEVWAVHAHRVLHNISSPDAHAVAMRLRSGAPATLSASWAHDPGEWKETNVLHLVLDGMLVRVDAAGAAVTPADRAQVPEVHGPDIYDAFLAAVRSKDPAAAGVLSPYRDAAATLAVSLAANTSGETGQPVRVPQI